MLDSHPGSLGRLGSLGMTRRTVARGRDVSCLVPRPPPAPPVSPPAMGWRLPVLGGMLLAIGVLLTAATVFLMAWPLLRPPRMTDGKAAWLLRRLSPGDLGLPYEDVSFPVRDE